MENIKALIDFKIQFLIDNQEDFSDEFIVKQISQYKSLEKEINWFIEKAIGPIEHRICNEENKFLEEKRIERRIQELETENKTLAKALGEEAAKAESFRQQSKAKELQVQLNLLQSLKNAGALSQDDLVMFRENLIQEEI